MKTIIVKYCQPAILFLLTFTIASIFSLILFETHHCGLMFKPALDVAHGQMLFRDTFTLYGALTTLLLAGALRIFGDYAMVIQIQTAFFYGLISVCLWYLWRWILPQWLTTASVVIWLLLAPYLIVDFFILFPWSSVYALFFQLFSSVLLLRALRKKSRFLIILSGSVAVLVFWCRQSVGIVHCAALIFFLATAPLLTGQRWKKAMTDCAFLITGIVAASAPFFVWLVLNGAIHDWYLQSIKLMFIFDDTLQQLKHLEVTSSSPYIFIRVLDALLGYHKAATHTSLIWILLPLTCLFLFAILVVKRWRNSESVKNNLPLYGILLVSLASWLQYYPIADVWHCYWAATPMIGLFSYGAWQLCSRNEKKLQILAVCITLTLVFGFDIERRMRYGFFRITESYEKVEEPKVLRGLYLYHNELLEYRNISISLNDAIKKNSFPYLVNLTSDAFLMTFIGPQNNFHPMYISDDIWNKHLYPDFVNRRTEFINTKHPVLLSYEGLSYPGWTCVDVFNMTDIRSILDKQQAPRRLALYRFTGKNKAP